MYLRSSTEALARLATASNDHYAILMQGSETNAIHLLHFESLPNFIRSSTKTPEPFSLQAVSVYPSNNEYLGFSEELETVLLEAPVPDVRDSQALGPNNAQQFKAYIHEVPGTHTLVSHLVQKRLLPLPLPSPPSVGTGFGCGRRRHLSS